MNMESKDAIDSVWPQIWELCLSVGMQPQSGTAIENVISFLETFKTKDSNPPSFPESIKPGVVVKVDYPEHDKIVLTNELGDTYTSRSEELMDFFHKFPSSKSTPGKGIDDYWYRRATLAEHLLAHSEPNKAYMGIGGVVYSRNQLVNEIENNSEVGNGIIGNIISLSIEMLSRRDKSPSSPSTREGAKDHWPFVLMEGSRWYYTYKDMQGLNQHSKIFDTYDEAFQDYSTLCMIKESEPTREGGLQDWIRVEDGLPETGGKYLTMSSDYHKVGHGWFNTKYNPGWEDDKENPLPVTHWKLLPSQPI